MSCVQVTGSGGSNGIGDGRPSSPPAQLAALFAHYRPPASPSSSCRVPHKTSLHKLILTLFNSSIRLIWYGEVEEVSK